MNLNPLLISQRLAIRGFLALLFFTLSACTGGGQVAIGSSSVPSNIGVSSNSSFSSISSVSNSSLSASLSSSSGGAASSASSTQSAASASSASISSSSTLSSASASTPMGQIAASRLLTQGTFGPTYAEIVSVGSQSYSQWFAFQANVAPSLTLASARANPSTSWQSFWWRNAVMAPDQLRQRVAFALSEIFVVGGQSDGFTGQGPNIAAYYDILVRNALGNYRSLLEEVTLSPEMGLYLNMFRNDKPDPATGRHADENYAREIMQLFSIGLVQLNLDGTVKTDINGRPLPTYAQAEVASLARVLTGWASRPSSSPLENAWLYDQNFIDPMNFYENHHDKDEKVILSGTKIAAGGSATNDLKVALDAIFNHPNVGPFIGKQLIQRLVTSNPSPAYVSRVASVFNNNGNGVRGDMLATVSAILTDPEAVNPGGRTYGKLREPILRLTHLWRAFNASDSTGGINDYQIVNSAIYIFGQQPMRSPSVFNFFMPDYVRSGPLAQAGMVVPEFQITNENFGVLTMNQIYYQGYAFVDSKGTKYFSPEGYSQVQNLGSGSVILRTADWETSSDTPSALMDRLALVFMQGKMPDAMRSTLLTYVSNIPNTEQGYRGYRAIEAANLIVNSPQYVVEQ